MKKNEIWKRLSLSGEEMAKDAINVSALRNVTYKAASVLQGRRAIRESYVEGAKLLALLFILSRVAGTWVLVLLFLL